MMERQEALNRTWQEMPLARRVFLALMVMLGFCAIVNGIHCLYDLAVPGEKTSQWATAFGAAGFLTSLYGFASWRPGAFGRARNIALALIMLAGSFLAIYGGIQALRASVLGVGLLQA